jgi:hypothetical protein
MKLVHKRPENFHHFSFLIQGGKILSMGRNLHIKHASIYPRGTYHSEYVAYKRGKGLLDRRKRWHIINIRLTLGHKVAISKPCSICQDYLRAMGCDRVIYTIEGDLHGTIKF